MPNDLIGDSRISLQVDELPLKNPAGESALLLKGTGEGFALRKSFIDP